MAPNPPCDITCIYTVVVITFSISHFQAGLHMKPCAYPRIIFGSEKQIRRFPCETQNVVFVLLVNIESPFHQHIPVILLLCLGTSV